MPGTPTNHSSFPDKFHASLTPNHPMATIDDLARMLEIDLIIGNRDDFIARLRKALKSAYQQGRKWHKSTQKRNYIARTAQNT